MVPRNKGISNKLGITPGLAKQNQTPSKMPSNGLAIELASQFGSANPRASSVYFTRRLTRHPTLPRARPLACARHTRDRAVGSPSEPLRGTVAAGLSSLPEPALASTPRLQCAAGALLQQPWPLLPSPRHAPSSTAHPRPPRTPPVSRSPPLCGGVGPAGSHRRTHWWRPATAGWLVALARPIC